ncbi:MAG: DUF1489 domain-containing protein [Pseudomonadota bacterium]
MTVHLIKLAAGSTGLESTLRWQKTLLQRNKGTALDGKLHHITRMMPRRVDDILDGGSLYWVMTGQVLMRQPIIGIDEIQTDEGRKCCLIFEPDPTLVVPALRKPFQGWRYLEPKDAPRDLDGAPDAEDLPIRAELAELGLL